MKQNPRDLIDGYFDDTLSSDQQVELGKWLNADPQHARQFAQASLVHDRLRNILAVEQNGFVVNDSSLVSERSSKQRIWFRSVTVRAVAVLVIVVIGFASLWIGIGEQTASAAVRELDRIIQYGMRSQDRTFIIVVEDMSTPTKRGNKRPNQSESPRPPKPPLDGAVLHVRTGNQFVLTRKTEDGLPFITGSNGHQSWAVNPRGAVKVSDDINEFNRDLPGHETSVPLTDLRSGLERLKNAYDLHFSTLGPEEVLPEDGATVRLLVAVKKPKERGPQRVEIIYDSTDGQILRVRFVQMPYGPERLDLRLNLLSEDELAPDFFEHSSHHAADRKVQLENRK